MFGFFKHLNPFHHRPKMYYEVEVVQDENPPPPVASQAAPTGQDPSKKPEGESFFGGIVDFFEKILKAISGFFSMIFSALFGHKDAGEQAPQAPGGSTPPPQQRAVLKDGPAPATHAPAASQVPAAATQVPAATSSGMSGYTVTDKLKISGAVNNLSLVSFRDPNPSPASANGADYTKLAAGLANMPNIKFYNAGTGQYEAVKSGNAAELSAAIANDPDKRFQVDLGNGKSVYLQQVLQVSRDESATGFAGASFRMVDEAGKPLGNEALMGFPGYTGNVNIGVFETTTDGSNQSRSMQAISEGKLNPQAPEALRLASDTLKAMGPDTAFLVSGDSMGDSNMRVAGAFLKGRGVGVQEISLEAVADTTEVARIKEALGQGGALRQQFLAQGVSEDKLPGLVDQASLGGIDLRSEFRKNGHSYYTAEAGIPIGGGLLPGMQLMGIKDGASRAGAGNDITGDSRVRLDITPENFNNPELAGHTGVAIMQALMHGDKIYVDKEGQALQETAGIERPLSAGQQPTAQGRAQS